jgi:hypothetical protein
LNPLRWQDGIRSAAEGTDLAGVAKGLADQELAFWIERFRRRPLPYELGILEREMERRYPDGTAGPLFRS